MRGLSIAGKVLAVAVTLVVLGGCCDDMQRQMAVLRLDNSELKKLLDEEQQKNRLCQERVASLQNDASRLNEVIDSKNQAITMLQSETATLQKTLDDRNAAYDQLVGKLSAPGGGGTATGRLPEDVGRRLRAMVSTYPGLLTFDEASGQLRFASDVTFDLGKADLKADAQKALRELAAILQQENALPVRVSIVGHTCTTRIAKAETKARFGDNQGLSEARAKSVGDFLTQTGVASSRISTSGRGSNDLLDRANPKSGRNRRVEIFLSMPPTP